MQSLRCRSLFESVFLLKKCEGSRESRRRSFETLFLSKKCKGWREIEERVCLSIYENRTECFLSGLKVFALSLIPNSLLILFYCVLMMSKDFFQFFPRFSLCLKNFNALRLRNSNKNTVSFSFEV